MTSLESLRRSNVLIESAIKSHQVTDRLRDLRSLISEKSIRLDEVLKFVKEARSYVADFPNEAQVLKFERRVESLKDQIKQAERIANQHRAGIDAYVSRLQANELEMRSVLDRATRVLEETSTITVPLVSEEANVVGESAALTSCDVLSSIAADREHELQEKCSSLDAALREEVALTSKAVALQLELEEQFPVVENEKSRDLEEIRSEWRKEEQALRSIQEKLFTVQREQSFHLQRGTHIKRKTVQASSPESEIVLSTRQSHLAAEVNKGKTALQDLKEELVQARKQVEVMRARAKEAEKQYECERNAREARLAAARKRHADAVAESQNLKNIRAELQQANIDLREIPHQTPRRQLRLTQ